MSLPQLFFLSCFPGSWLETSVSVIQHPSLGPWSDIKIPSYYLLYFNNFPSKSTKISRLSIVIVTVTVIDLYFTWASYSSSSMVALPGTVAMVLFWMKSFSLLISSLTRLFNCSLLQRERKRYSIALHVVHTLCTRHCSSKQWRLLFWSQH